MGSWVCGCGFVGVSVDKFDTDLFGEGKFNLLAVGFSESSGTFLDSDFRVFDGGNLDGTFFLDGIALDNGQADGFVDAGLLRGGVGNSNGDIDRGDNRDIVGSFLGNFLAVVVSITTIPVSMMSRLADSNHLYISFLFKSNLNCFGSFVFSYLFIRVTANLLRNNFNALSTYSAGNCVGKVNFFDDFDGQSNNFTCSFNDRCTHLSSFYNIKDRAVVFRCFITITTIAMTVDWGMSITWGWSIMSWCIAISRNLSTWE